MHSTNRHCNALQSLIGVFLHANGTPETICELLAHMGLSVSTKSIEAAVKHLSKEAEKQIREEEHKLLMSYAYNNLDIDLKVVTPTIERSGNMLIHLMMATMLPLHPSVTLDDLDCAETVWKQSVNNPKTGQKQRTITMDQLRSIHQELEIPQPHSNLKTRQQ